MLARYSTAIATGTIATFTLVYVMQMLIAMQPDAEVNVRPRGTLQFVRVERNEEIRTDEATPPAIKDHITPPVEPPRPRQDDGNTTKVGVTHHTPPPTGFEGNGIDMAFSDGPLVAVVRVQPVYPPPMAVRGIDGHVTVEFDVLADGSVANVVVVESSHSGFEKAAVKAAYKFRFKARVIDGVPQVSIGIRNRFRFTMEQ